MKKSTLILLLLCQFTLFSQDYKFGKVSKEELEEKFYPLDSTADAAYLYRSRRTYYDFIRQKGDFQLITEIYERIKIYTKEGFEKATKSIAFYDPENGEQESVGAIKGYTHTLVNGKIEKEKLNKKSIFRENKNKYTSIKKITMPNVKEGCVIEIKYKLFSPYSRSIDELRFQYEIPIKKLNYQIEIPEFYIFNKRSKGYYFVKMNQSSKSGSVGSTNFSINVFTFKDKDIPAVRNDEPYVSSVYNYRGGMKFELTQIDFLSLGGDLKTFSNTWEDVSKQIFKSSRFGSELNKSNYYKEDLEKIVAVAKTPPQKLSAIFQFVKSKVKWNGYSSKYTDKGVRRAFKERVGNVADINLMLTSMLRSAGLNANPVILSTRSNGFPVFPTIDGFNYVISMVEFDNGAYVLLDASEEFSLPNVLPQRALNWNGRKVTKEGISSWVKLNSSKHATEENHVITKISEDLIVKGLIRTKYNNLNALNFRKNNNHIKEESIISKLEETNSYEIEDFKVLNKTNLAKPIIRNIKFSSEDLIEDVNGKLYIEPLLFLTQHNNPFKLEERKFPVDFSAPWKDKNIVTIEIPKGYKVEKIPEPLGIGLPDRLGLFRYQVTQKGNKINAMSVLQFNTGMIAPQYYAALKDFYGQLVKKESEKIVLVKM